MATQRASFVKQLVKDPASPPDVMMLSGYPGDSAEEDSLRLYFDESLSGWVDVPRAAVAHEMDGDGGEFGPVKHVWVHREAADRLRYGAPRAPLQPGPFPPSPLIVHCGPSPFVHCPPSPFVQCPPSPLIVHCGPTPFGPCLSHSFPRCPPSPFIYQCRTPFRPCFTQPLHGCPPSPVIHVCPSPFGHLCPPKTPVAPCLATANQPICQTLSCPVATPACPVQSAVMICQTPGCPVASAFSVCQTLSCPSAVDACPSAPGGCGDPFTPQTPLFGPGGGFGGAFGAGGYGFGG